MQDFIYFDIGIIIMASALLAWLSLLLRQPIIIAYILAGIALGPWGLRLVSNIDFIDEVSKIGITLLLFIAGLSLHPGKIVETFGRTFTMTVATSLIFALVSGGILLAIGLTPTEAVIGGGAMMFSSTILVVKLMPTSTLHQQHMGALGIAVLIIQDLMAILLIAFIKGKAELSLVAGSLGILKGVLLVVVALVAQRALLSRVIKQVERYRELLTLLVLGWCFGIALTAEAMGLSHETGAFIAGVSLADHLIARVIAEELKMFRDFFLVLFFFALGAQLDFSLMTSIALPALLLSALLLFIKPLVFRRALKLTGETPKFSKELSVRLGQNSEFAFVIAVIAAEQGLLSNTASQLLHLVTILTMAVSSYILVSYYPSPLASKPSLKID
ncbi:sodium:proton exchanger [Chlorobaculum sp. 24CR]|uniref:cation:proton antiporter domain-containing protein n=1 Tax=Chlorobaculum sp. 24CR TaxID=2508878 RepID=UPI00100AB77A|nr:cation:proton antiporter [Chlorobaculum sp. 24CR]RXK88209.1 sodium:proton exchanger [Chlorobaculum sp. 24CR]